MACVFCEIVAGRAPAHIIEDSEHAIALLDINPFAEGHTLVVSKRHEPWWNDLHDDEIASVFALAKRVANRLRETFSPEFICMYARGKRIPHTHVFLVPSRSGDVLDGFFNAMERVQESPQHLAELKKPEALAGALRKLLGR